MDTFRKWLNKPKADDKSLLARFYHADRSLTAVASELDSFDGRAEPDRCSRLVNRLRQNQDKVLAITNLIMEELLGEDRDPRSFRAKFPEEVLQENLAGQLWFGAECLAAGSSIINREQESKEMRPLAQAVTKSLGNVRNLLRDQCLRNNVPNSRTLHLDLNDSTTEQLCESLKIFDRLFAEFELRYVSAMVQVKTKHEYEMQQMICVLFSETLQRALKTGLLDQDKVDAFDPALMFSIPRLAIIAGLVIYHRGPLNMDMPADQLSEMFRPFRTILIKIRDLLRTLNKNELYQLERLLCTNEDIHLKVQVGSSSIEAPNSDQQNNNSNSNNCDETTGGGDDNNESTARPTTTARRHDNNNSSSAEPSTSPKKVLKSVNGGIPPGGGEMGSRRAAFTMRHLSRTSVSSVSVNSSAASTPSVSPSASPTPSHSIASTSSAVSMSTTSPADWTDDDDDEEDDSADELENTNVLPTESDIVANDCASGFLIPNTNFGNLLQPQEVPLTDNFIASEDEFASNQNEGDVEDEDEDDYDDHDHDHDDGDSNDLPTTSTALLLSPANGGDGHHQMHHNRHSDSSEDSEQLTIKASTKSLESCDTISNGPYGKVVEKSCASGVSKSSDSGSCSSNSSSCRQHRHHHHRSQDHTNNKAVNEVSSGSSGSSAVVRRHHHHHHHTHPHPHRHHHHHHHHHRHHHSKSKRSSLEGGEEGSGGEHKDTSSAAATTTTTITTTTTTSWSSKLTKSMQHDTSSPDSSTSSSPSDGDPHEVSLALRAAGRLKFKSTENLLHRLFVCIAGVADQLQTNFAYDLRQILRSVFLMNMSLAQDDIIDIPEKTKDSELFEFRASENDVIQESAGSNQSIYSAEEVNPELDNVFNNSGSSSGGGRRSTGSSGSNSVGGIQRVNTIDLGTTGGGDATMAASHNRSHIGRTRSLGDQEGNVLTTSSTTSTTSNNRQLSSYISGRRLSSPHRQQSTTSTTSHHQSSHRHRNRNNSVGSNSPTNSSTSSSSSAASSSSESNSPVSERVSGGGGYSMSPRQQQQQQHLNAGANNQSPITAISNNINNNNMPDAASSAPPASQSQAQSPPNARLAPPAWIPDDKAPRCMSCHTPFTAFRRRHHCRNCGGVFCGVCSNSSAPLPKYGLTKAVRVCRECYVREVRGRAASVHNGSVSTGRSNASPRALSSSAASAAAATAGGS